ncbi:MAG: hypothetical protein E3J43_09960 [Candidatus Heimdallarchaeota archaeon]|nr:MAG: hypothetical protein E3J43_09960 [Candidatus Heimdallarchaeota archaeon]
MTIEGQRIKIPRNYLDPVTYIPSHVPNRNASHSDCEQGVIMDIVGENTVKVLFCKSRTVQSVNVENLVFG